MSSWCDQLVSSFVTVAEGPISFLIAQAAMLPDSLRKQIVYPSLQYFLLALFLAAAQKELLTSVKVVHMW